MSKPNTSKINEQIVGSDGYTFLQLTASELEVLRDCIRDQWLYRLQLVVPREMHQFSKIKMDQYHTLAHLVDHAKIWPKYSRVLPQGGVKLLRQMAFFKQLEAEYGKILIGDEEEFGWENISWRLVRPKQKDVGPIHADEWFWELRNTKRVPGYIPMKIWIAIYNVPGKNGLRLVPGSHLERDRYRYRAEERGELTVPAFDGNEDELPSIVTDTKPGDMVVFNHDLLHGGVFNKEETTRVSVDFTILVDEKFDARAAARNYKPVGTSPMVKVDY